MPDHIGTTYHPYFTTNGDYAVTVSVWDGSLGLVAKAELLLQLPAKRTFLLVNVLVYKRYRGNGYGNHLMEAIIHYANRKKRGLFLKVKDDNAVAIHLYEKYGFKQCGSGYDYFYYKRQLKALAGDKYESAKCVESNDGGGNCAVNGCG